MELWRINLGWVYKATYDWEAGRWPFCMVLLQLKHAFSCEKKNTSMGIMDSKKTKTGTSCFFWLMNYGGFPKKLLSLQPIYGDPGCKMRVIDGYVVWDLVEFHGNYYKL